jgi:hypothetical protein
MKYIVIVAIVACTSFQVMAQQNSEPTSLKIFGSTSLSSVEPLFIIADDQINREITQKEFEKIDPSDIQSVSVLKERKALEVYGEKGRNGVIILVMKGDSFSETFPGNAQPAKEK